MRFYPDSFFFVDDISLGGGRRKTFKVLTLEMLCWLGEVGRPRGFGPDGLSGRFLLLGVSLGALAGGQFP